MNASLRVAQLPADAGTFQRFEQSVAFDGLEQVVDDADRKRLDREVIEGGHEDDLGHRCAVVPAEHSERVDQLEAVELRHLDVEQHHIGRQRANQLQATLRIAGRADQGNSRHVLQAPFQAAQCQRFVIDREHSQFCHSVNSIGRRSSTVNRPSPGAADKPAAAP